MAAWVFEPESEAVGMRDGAFEGPLVSGERIDRSFEEMVGSGFVNNSKPSLASL